MTPNQEYKRIFARTYDGLRTRKLAIYQEASERFRACVEKEKAKRRPKGKAGKKYELPEDVVAELRERFKPELTEYEFLDNAITQALANNSARLYELAEQVEVVPTEIYYRVASRSSSAYSTQGYGKEKYAKGALLPFELSLAAAGLTPHISRVVTYRNANWKYSCDAEVADFRLWVNCEPYVADAIEKRITLGEACKMWKSQQINPFVYNPFIPRELGSFP